MTLLDSNLISDYLRPKAREQSPVVWEFVEGLRNSEGLAISYLTKFELRRGIEELIFRGDGRRKLVALLKFVESVRVLGLDASNGAGWDVAAKLWAKGRAMKPAIVLSEADLLVAATAQFHGLRLATADRKLATRLSEIGYEGTVHFVDRLA